jgi:hypothetical protein
MPKLNLSAPQREIIEVIAHIAVMGELDKNVEGMSGVLERYINKTLTSKQRAIYQALQDRIVTVRKDLLRMTKEEWR